jgi:eukaryotic-like serine/threonine-protein kinase
MDTTLARLPIGQLLDGRYRVDSRIARGGMATVYLGADTRLERTVALKIAHPELATDADFVRRFIEEARSVARLSSPNVVAVYDQGSDGDILFLAMEYVPGRTLRELLVERGRLSPRESLDIIEGVLNGLAAAHQSGIVHRDVKPENVLLTPSHAVKVADFGLARAAASASQTKTGMIIGTAAYLAPEQVSRSVSDARTDVYASGVMLFELLTGVQPHKGESPLEVAYKHVNEIIPAPSSITPGLAPALDALVALATSRDPDLRPADAGQFLRAITEVRRGLPIAVPHAPDPSGSQGSGYEPGFSPGQPASGDPASGQPAPGQPVSWEPLSGQPVSWEPASWGTVPGQPTSWAPEAGQPAAALTESGQSPPGQPGPASAGQSVPGQSYPGQSAPGQWPPGQPYPRQSVPGQSTSGPMAAGQPGTSSPFPAASAGPGSPAVTGPLGETVPGAQGAPPLPGASAFPAAFALPAASALSGAPASPGTSSPAGPGGRSEPRHGKSGRGRAVEILPAVTTGQPGDPYDGVNHTLIVTGGDLAGGYGGEPLTGRVHGPAGIGRRREPGLQRWLFSRRLAYLALALAVVLVLGLLTWWLIDGQYVAVPRVDGMAKSTARTELRNLGFTVETAHGLRDNAVPRGEVIRTDPAIGSRAHRGSTITLVPSLGPVLIQVPSVTGMKVADAETALRRAGLTPGRVSSATSTTIPLGIVISTNPIAGLSWPQPRPVAIVESAGIPLPALVGQQESAAQQQSQQDGFQLNPEQDAKSNQPAGTITGQSPKPGTPITPGEVVTIRVSAGPQMVNVPNVDGLWVQHAISILQAAGFQVNVNAVGPGHHVFNYNPAGQAPQGSTITIFVGFGGGLP